MTDDDETSGTVKSAKHGSQHSKKGKVALVDHLPSNPLVTAVHGLRKQVSLPPLGGDENDGMTPGKHETKNERGDGGDGEDANNGTGSPTATDASSGSDKSPCEQDARPRDVAVPVSGAAIAKPNCDGGDVTMTSTDATSRSGTVKAEVVAAAAEELPPLVKADRGELKKPPGEEDANRSDFWTMEDGLMEEVALHPSLDALSLSDDDGAEVAKAAARVDAPSDVSTSPSSSLMTPEEMSEEALDRDRKCAADAAVRNAPLPKPRLRPPLRNPLPDETNLKESHSTQQHKQALYGPVADDRPQDARRVSFKHAAGEQHIRMAPLMMQQSSGSGNLGDVEENGFGEESTSPPVRNIGKKISRAGQKIGDGLAALRPRGTPIRRKGSDVSRPTLTSEDIEICQRLDEEYERALEEREVGWAARYNSVRQSACLSLTFMFVYLILGTLFFQRHTSWDIPDSLLFTIYTITTVGYGNHYLPTNPGFQLFVVFYIFVGIATLTIMVAQVYQCIALEATRAQFSRDKADMIRRNNERAEVTGTHEDNIFAIGSHHNGSTGSLEFNQQAIHNSSCSEQSFHAVVHAVEVTKHFLHYNKVGRAIAFVLPFIGLILVGALVVGSIEGWTFVESIYFSVVSLTTVGFGDYYPTEKSSIWFCICWLPFSVGFMSLYLGSVAHFYISLSNSNIQRMERRMRRRIRKAKEAAERERQEAYARAMAAAGQEITVEHGGDEASPQDVSPSSPNRGRKRRSRGFATLPGSDMADEDDSNPSEHGALFGSPEQEEAPYGSRRRERIINNASMEISSSSLKQSAGQTMATMNDVLKTVKAHIRRKSNRDSFSSVFVGNDVMGPEVEFMSVRSSKHRNRLGLNVHEVHGRKPSFALRALVQERVAEIIASDIAGYQSHVEIKENTLRITIDTLKSTTDKWLIPRRARKAFRAVAFEVLYFVGEHGLITRGADALYDLTPFEFHGLFGPFLAAMGDAETMEVWLGNTDVLADVELRKDTTRPSLAVLGKDGVSSRHLATMDSIGSESSRPMPGRQSPRQSKKPEAAKENHQKATKISPPNIHRRSNSFT